MNLKDNQKSYSDKVKWYKQEIGKLHSAIKDIDDKIERSNSKADNVTKK